MRSLSTYIDEARLRDFKGDAKAHNYHPKTKEELEELVGRLIKERGNKADLNDIDTSAVKDMSRLFYRSKFNGDISKWDVSKVKDMCWMFIGTPLENNPPKWYHG